MFFFELQHIYRSLDVLAKESDNIQATLYKICQVFLLHSVSILATRMNIYH